MLENLDRGNLLIVPLDEQRQWYRYHHLFAEVLQARALMELPDLVPGLHRRASAWYAANGPPAEAIGHALAAQDFARAADLVERAWPEMNQGFEEENWLQWARALPQEVVRVRPVLSLDFAWALLNRGALEAAEVHLRDAETWLDPAQATAVSSRELVYADEEQYRVFPAALASARAFQAQALGDVPGTVQYGRRALDLYPPQNHLDRGVVATILGLAYWSSGDLEAAHSTFSQGIEDMQAAGNILFALRGTYVLADIRLAQGRLQEAINTYKRLLQLAEQHGEPVLRGTADLYLRLSELYFEQDNKHAAEQQLQRGAELGGQAATPVWQYRLRLAQALNKKAQGDLDGALELLDAAERRYVRTPVPDVRPIQALKARVWIAQGRLAEARAWARAQALVVADQLSYVREFEHITLARLLIAEHRRDPGRGIEAIELLERLLHAAQAGGRMGSAIEILLLQALGYEAQGNSAQALTALERALQLAEPQGYVRIFVDEGEPMARLLALAQAQGILPGYTTRLLAAFTTAPAPGPAAQPLIEPLSSRELEILGLIAQGLSNRQISERLFLALSTVKGHNGRIYAKLAVRRRTEAVARARELGLL
jgi:LuxR family maltose regulon positive regulatory protein